MSGSGRVALDDLLFFTIGLLTPAPERGIG